MWELIHHTLGLGDVIGILCAVILGAIVLFALTPFFFSVIQVVRVKVREYRLKKAVRVIVKYGRNVNE